MLLSCPKCGFFRKIDPAKLPLGARRATCPKCGHKFNLPMVRTAGPAATADTPPDSRPTQPPLWGEGSKPDRDLPGREAEAVEPFPAPPPLPSSMPPSLLPPKPEQPIAGSAARRHEPSSVPDGVFATIKMVLFRPGEFFDRMPVRGGKRGPLGFAVLVWSICLIISIVIQATLAILLSNGKIMAEIQPTGPVWLSFVPLAILLLFSPLFVIVILYVQSALIHVFLLIVRGANGGFEATFRVVAYASAVKVWNVIPYAGWLLSVIWLAATLLTGLPRAHHTGVGRVVIALFILPLALLMVILPFLGILAALIIPNATPI